MPTTNFALNLQMAWKGFDLSLLFQGSAGRKDFWNNKYTEVILPDKRMLPIGISGTNLGHGKIEMGNGLVWEAWLRIKRNLTFGWRI